MDCRSRCAATDRRRSRAAIGWRESQQLKLARFGDNMRDVAVTEGDKVEAQRVFGISVNTYSVNELVELVEAAKDDVADVDAVVKEYADRFNVAPELLPGGERHDSLRYAAQQEIGLRRFLDEGGFGAFTTNFENLGGLRQLPGIAVQRLMSDGYGFGGEGDWKTSALSRVLKTMANGLAGGTSFMEDYTYHFGPGSPKVLGAHMLEVCPSIAVDTPRVEVHPLSIGGREDPVRLVFDATPGSATVLGLADLGERFRLVANQVEIVPPDEPLPRLPVARAVWKPQPDFTTGVECWLQAGGPHHTVLTAALDIETLEDYAAMAGTELAMIGAGTDKRRFNDELRWHAAYHRLARAL